MIYFYYLLSILLIYFSLKSLVGGISFLNFFKKELAKPRSTFTPFVSIIAPCRGIDHGLESNLSALFQQDFPNFEIIFVTDSGSDESVRVIGNVSHRWSKLAKSKIVFAGNAVSESQKVHNLREAVLQISKDSEVLVFVDSDARPA